MSWYILFKKDDSLLPPAKLREELEGIGRFLKFEMSARNIEFKLMRSPLEAETANVGSVFTLEYPMREFGAMERNQKVRRTVRQAKMIKMTAAIPPPALDYIMQKLYANNNIVRFMTFH